MEEELESIERNNTWELVDHSNGKKVIGLKWVYKTKLDSEGKVQKFKARLVAKGYTQQSGVDFDEVFAPVARMETMRVLFALAAQLDWPVYHFDVKSAFLNGVLQEEVYVEQPVGYEVKGSKGKVLKLKKALYGLRQAPRAWYARIDAYLLQQGFVRSVNEHTLYKRLDEENNVLLMSIYVDDIVYMSSSQRMVQVFKEEMQETFEMTDLGILNHFLGIEVRQSKAGIFITQRQYIEDILKTFKMHQSKAVTTPMFVNEKLQVEKASGGTDAKVYRSLVGRLLYATHTRPDISYAVGILSRFVSNPSKQHYDAGK